MKLSDCVKSVTGPSAVSLVLSSWRGRKRPEMCGHVQKKKNSESFLNFCSPQLVMIKVFLR